ncbi:MAG: hypothetical protein AAB296_05450 [Candidatus Desantisbacteria bacterium]
MQIIEIVREQGSSAGNGRAVSKQTITKVIITDVVDSTSIIRPRPHPTH